MIMNSSFLTDAAILLGPVTAIGSQKTDFSKSDGRVVRSLSTLNNYVQCVAHFLKWRFITTGLLPDSPILLSECYDYLDSASTTCTQPTLDQKRLALETVIGYKLQGIESEIIALHQSRALTQNQYKVVLQQLSSVHRFIILLCLCTGLRVAEIAQLPPMGWLQRSPHRQWLPNLFLGQSDAQIRIVIGKGRLLRPIGIPPQFLDELESFALPSPELFLDRKIVRERFYAFPTSQTISQSFAMAACEALGYSPGAHSTRHFFAQDLLQRLVRQGMSVFDCLPIVSQRLGHFDPSVTYAYF